MPEPGEALSEREKEVLRLVATGATNEQIARELVISTNTVKVHLRNIFAKLGVTSRTEASLHAIRQGWITVETPAVAAAEKTAPAEPAVLPRPVPHWPRWLALAAVAILMIVLILSLTGLVNRILPTPSPSALPITPITVRRWTIHMVMPTPRSDLALLSFQNALYAIGGEGLQGVSPANERFDLKAHTWASLASKPTAVAEAQAAVLGGNIYVPGGRTAQGQPTAVTEVYDVERNRWSTAAPLPRPLSAYALAPFEGKLYLLGGWDGSQYRDEILRYSPETNQWEEAGRLPSPRGYAGAAVANDRILLIGGVDAVGSVNQMAQYSPALATVETQPLTATLGYAQATICLRDSLFVLAASNPPSTPQIWQPNLGTGAWYRVERSPSDPELYPGAGFTGAGTQLFLVGGKKDGKPLGLTLEFQALFVYSEPLPAPVP
jgi:DNA-binding CsgD family transcriptional regulator